MSVDNLIRKENQRLVRLAKWAGKKSLLMKKPTDKIESLFGKEEIRRFLVDKFKKENPPKNEKEIKTLQKRADAYARKNAKPGYEYRNGVIQIKRDKITSEFAKTKEGILGTITPTKTDIKKKVRDVTKRNKKNDKNKRGKDKGRERDEKRKEERQDRGREDYDDYDDYDESEEEEEDYFSDYPEDLDDEMTLELADEIAELEEDIDDIAGEYYNLPEGKEKQQIASLLHKRGRVKSYGELRKIKKLFEVANKKR